MPLILGVKAIKIRGYWSNITDMSASEEIFYDTYVILRCENDALWLTIEYLRLRSLPVNYALSDLAYINALYQRV